MPGVTDLPSLEDINAQFLNHHAYYDITISSQQKPFLAMKNCPHPIPFRRHNRNQHGFTIHCSNCNCRLLFAKKYEAIKTADGHCHLIQKVNSIKSLEIVAGTASLKRNLPSSRCNNSCTKTVLRTLFSWLFYSGPSRRSILFTLLLDRHTDYHRSSL